MPPRTGPSSSGGQRTPLEQRPQATPPRTIRGAWTSAPPPEDAARLQDAGAQRRADPTTATLTSSEADAEHFAAVASPARAQRRSTPPPLPPRGTVKGPARTPTRNTKALELTAPQAPDPNELQVSPARDSKVLDMTAPRAPDPRSVELSPIRNSNAVGVTAPQAADPSEVELSVSVPRAAQPWSPPSLAPVARRVEPAGPRFRSAWFGWAAALVLLVAGMAFYALAYAPLRRELDRVRRASATQQGPLDRQRAVSLEPRSERPESAAPQVRAVAKPDALQPTAAEHASGDEHEAREHGIRDEREKDAAPSRAQRVQPAVANDKHRSSSRALRAAPREPSAATEPSGRRANAHGKVDRAAAAAATAALEAEAYGPTTPYDSKSSDGLAAPLPATAPRTADKSAPRERPTEKQDGLAGVVKDSSDPLDGL